MKLPKMIGAHTPRRPSTKPQRCTLTESASMINRAFDEWTRRPTRTHLVRVITPGTPQR